MRWDPQRTNHFRIFFMCVCACVYTHAHIADRYPATDYGMGYGQMDYTGSSQYGVPVRLEAPTDFAG